MQTCTTMTSQHSTLDAAKALANYLYNSLASDPETARLVTEFDQITFSAPKTAALTQKRLIIFLFAVEPNRFLVIPCTENEEDNMQIFGKALQILKSKPVFPMDNQQAGTFTASVETLSLGELCSLWLAIGEPLRPSICLTVSSALEAISQAAPPRSTRILELFQTVFTTFEQQLNDWKNGNMFQRQYIMSEFSKTTGMSADIMHGELRTMSERLQAGKPVTEFISSVKLLQEFYERQFDMLKGFDRVQKKRKEGIELVAKRKADVEALLEALTG